MIRYFLCVCLYCTSYTVKKKHLAQNKEIIHKNSELNKLVPGGGVPVSNSHSCLIPVSLSVCVSVPACRTNAELNRNITLLRAERLSLKGSQFQLECENASLRTRLQQAQDREQDLINQLEQYKTSDSVVNNGNSPGSTSITEQQLQVRIKYRLHNRSYGQAQGASQPSAPAVTMNGADNHPQSL